MLLRATFSMALTSALSRSHDLIVYICSFLPSRRTGVLLAEGEAVAQRSPAVGAIQAAASAEADAVRKGKMVK